MNHPSTKKTLLQFKRETAVTTKENRSTVARLLAQIQAEDYAFRQALTGFSEGTARHEFIEKRQENIAITICDIREVYGDTIADEVMTSLPDDNGVIPNCVHRDNLRP